MVPTAKRTSTESAPDGRGIRLGLVTAEFNGEVTQRMRDRALATAKRLGVEVTHDVSAPGSFDVPVVARALLERDDVDAVVALGAIIQGETYHDVLIGHAAVNELARLAVEFRKPVGLGITGPRQTKAQAEARIKNAAWAVESAVRQARVLEQLGKSPSRAHERLRR